MLITIGLLLVVLGLWLSGKLPFLGRLPGDIRIEWDGFVFYFPLTSMLLISAILTLIIAFLRR